MPIAVVTATVKEMHSALAFAGPPMVREGEPAPLVLGGRECVALATGVGLVNAALGLGDLLARERVDGVLNLGVAGSFDPDLLPLCGACAATGEIWPEYGLETPHGPDAEAIGFPQARLDHGTVWNGLPLDPDAGAEAMGLRLAPGMARGISLSVGTVTGSAQRAEALRDRHGALMENMEGFALALGCARRKIPFLEIRTASNLTGSRRGWDLRGALAALGTTARALFSVSGKP